MMLLVLFILITLLGACNRSRDLVILLPEEQNGASSVSITTQSGPMHVLNTAYSALEVKDHESQPLTLSEADVQKIFKYLPASLPKPGRTFVFYFDVGATELTPDSQSTTMALLEEIKARETVEVEITGHTDTVGELENNDKLSLDRADLVYKILKAAGLDASFARVVGRGERGLLIPTADNTDEPRNRRVEVIVR